MRKINLVKTETQSSADVLRLVAGSSPHRPLSIDIMRRRVHILDALDAVVDNALYLEEEDHKCLVDALQNFPWATASAALLKIIDDVIDAEQVPAVRQVSSRDEPIKKQVSSRDERDEPMKK